MTLGRLCAAFVLSSPACLAAQQPAPERASFWAIGGDSVSFLVFVLGAPQPIAAVVRRIAPDSVRLDYAGASMHLAVSPDGRVLGGVVPAQGITIVRGPAGPPLGVVRPRSLRSPARGPRTATSNPARFPATGHSASLPTRSDGAGSPCSGSTIAV